jgi:ABC-type transport system substrate-binding protein
VFKLRPGVKFQNVAPLNGRPFTADDVVYSLKRFASLGLLTSEFSVMESVVAQDPQTVAIKLKQPNADFLVSPIAKNQTLMLPHEIGDADGDFQKRAVGTGPFIMTTFDKAVRVAFKKNPDYWGKDKSGATLPYLDEYEMLIGDNQAQLTGFLSGQIDLPYQTLKDKAANEDLLSKKSDAIPYRWDGDVNTYNIAFQLKTKPFNDVRVRRAFSLAINWKGINQVVFSGEASDSLFFYPWKKVLDKAPTRDDLGPWFKYDPAQAKKLLADAGYPNGFPATVEYNEYNPELTSQLAIIQQQLKDVGIDLSLKKVEYTAFFDKWSKKSWESITLGFVPASAQSMDAWTYGSLLSGAPGNYWDVNDPQLDALLNQQHTETDEAKRRPIWKQIWDKELDQVWRLPTLQSTATFYGSAVAHGSYTPTRYHSYWNYGGAELVRYWRG